MLNWVQIAKHSALVAAEQLWSRLHSSTLLDWNSYSKPWAVEARYWTHRPNPTLGMRYHEPSSWTYPYEAGWVPPNPDKWVQSGQTRSQFIYIYIYPTPHPKSSKSDGCQISAMTCYDSSMTHITRRYPLEPDCCRAKELRAPSPGISWWWPSPKGQAPLSTGPLRWSRPPSSWRGQQMIHVWKRDETCTCFLMWGITCIAVNHIESPPTKFVGFLSEEVWKPFLLLHQPTSGKNDMWIHVTAMILWSNQTWYAHAPVTFDCGIKTI